MSEQAGTSEIIDQDFCWGEPQGIGSIWSHTYFNHRGYRVAYIIEDAEHGDCETWTLFWSEKIGPQRLGSLRESLAKAKDRVEEIAASKPGLANYIPDNSDIPGSFFVR